MKHFSVRLFFHAIKVRPRLLVGISLACLISIFLPETLVPRTITRILVGWNVGVIAYLILVAHMCLQSNLETMRVRATGQSESRIITIVLVILAAVAAQAAIVLELSTVKDLQGTVRRHI